MWKKANKNDKLHFYHEYGGNVFICIGNKELHIKNAIVVENIFGNTSDNKLFLWLY